MKKKRKKHNVVSSIIVLLAKTDLKAVEVFICKALID